MKYIVGNWKSHKTLDETREWFEEIQGVFKQLPQTTVVVAVPNVYVFEARKVIDGVGLSQLKLAVQDISAFPMGAYTGAVNAKMVEGVVEFAIVGHSERREYFHETNQEVANKVRQLVEAGIKPIVCVDMPYAKQQLAAIDENLLPEIVVAYEPIEAIGSGNPEEPEAVKKSVDEIKSGFEGAVIYGGSINENNARSYLEIEGVDGLLPGGSSLDPKSFWAVCSASLS